MKKHMLKTRLKWIVLLLVSSLVLIWRSVDFTNEAVNEGFHMTRGGIALWGGDAEVIQIIIILGSLAFIWKAIVNLVRLHVANLFR